MVPGMTSDFRPLAKRGLPTLVHPDVSEDVKSEMIEMSMRVGPKTYVRQNRAVSARRDLREMLPRIAVPTSVIVGEKDVLVPVARSREIHDLARGSTLHIIPDCGHLPPTEKRTIVANLLRELMATRPGTLHSQTGRRTNWSGFDFHQDLT